MQSSRPPRRLARNSGSLQRVMASPKAHANRHGVKPRRIVVGVWLLASMLFPAGASGSSTLSMDPGQPARVESGVDHGTGERVSTPRRDDESTRESRAQDGMLERDAAWEEEHEANGPESSDGRNVKRFTAKEMALAACVMVATCALVVMAAKDRENG